MQSFQEQPLPEHPAPRPGQPCSRVFPGPARLQVHPAKVGTSLSGRQAGMDTNPAVALFYGGCKKWGGQLCFMVYLKLCWSSERTVWGEVEGTWRVLCQLKKHFKETEPFQGPQLSNLWWIPNSVSKGFATAMKTGSSRRFKLYPTTYMWVSSWLPFTVD